MVRKQCRTTALKRIRRAEVEVNTGAPSRKCGNRQQGERRNSILAKVVAHIPAAEHNNGRRKVTTIFSSPGGIGLYGEKIFSRAAPNRPDIVLEGVKRHIS